MADEKLPHPEVKLAYYYRHAAVKNPTRNARRSFRTQFKPQADPIRFKREPAPRRTLSKKALAQALEQIHNGPST